MLLTALQALDVGIGLHEVAVGGTLAGAVVQLIKTNLLLDRNTRLADIVAAIATYTGYANAAITWDAPSLAVDGSVQVLGTVPEFRPTDAVAPNVIFGIAVLKADSSAAYFVGVVDPPSPRPMNSALNTLNVTIQWNPRTGGFSVFIP